MARPRKSLGMQEGNLTKEQQSEKALQEDIIKAKTNQLDKCPSWLRDNVAKKEFKRLVEEFRAIGIISNLDLNNLGIYCNFFSSYVETTKELIGQPISIEHTNKFGAKNTVEHPSISTQLKYADEMKKYSSLLGLTIDSRLKLATIKLAETKKEIVNDFGDI